MMLFLWILPGNIPRRRLAIVGGRYISTMAKYTELVNALDINLVVLGPLGHWLEDLCEAAYC